MCRRRPERWYRCTAGNRFDSRGRGWGAAALDPDTDGGADECINACSNRCADGGSDDRAIGFADDGAFGRIGQLFDGSAPHG